MSNKYIYPICFKNSNTCRIEVVTACSFAEAKDKIIDKYLDRYDSLDYCDWDDFVEDLEQKENVIIGLVEDIETL